VDGQLHALRVTEKASASSKSKPRIGEKDIYELTGNGISARVVCTITRPCKSGDECEATEYRATITVRTQKGTRELQAWAICGC
jgi:hypothetical protein